MKAIAPLLILLAACGREPDLSPLKQELAALRAGMDELKKGQQPTFDREQVLEDLTKEVRRLRTAPPPDAPQPAPAPVVLPATLQGGALAGGVGGTQSGINDLYWVLTKLQVEKEDRVVLALYQAQPNGRGFKLAGVRMLTADLQIVEYGQEKPHVREVLEELKKMKK